MFASCGIVLNDQLLSLINPTVNISHTADIFQKVKVIAEICIY